MIARLGEKLIRKILSAEVMGLILVAVALQALSYGIASSLLDTDTRYFFRICLIAAAISFGLSRSRLKPYQAALGIVALGVIGVWILGARLTAPLLDLGVAILRIVQEVSPQIIPAIRDRVPIGEIDATNVTAAWSVIVNSSSALAERWSLWLAGLVGKFEINDALIRNMVWTLIMWLFAAWAGWFSYKRNAVVSLFPSVGLLAAVISYSEYQAESLWLLVTTLLLLMGVWNYKNHAQGWRQKNVDYSDSIRYDLTQAVVVATIAIGIISFITPSITWKDIRDFIRDWNRNETAELLGVKQEPNPAKPVSSGPQPSLPRDHLLSGGFALSQNVVMTIKTGELPPIPDPALVERASKYYWRSVVYDKYVSAGWVTSASLRQVYPPDTPIIPGLLTGYKPVHMQVLLAEPEGRLFWSGVLFSADIPFTANWRFKPDADLFADQSVLLQADLFSASTTATSYELESYVPMASVKQLRSASTDYPEDVQARYFVLPSTVPDRVIQLGRQLTKGVTNPYEKAKIIEDYLRATYPYDLDIPTPPEGQDVVDYFLFDLKRGYCDYFASSMVVLARANGLPARFVSGYATGTYDPPTASYIVRELNAHSWVEIYFPGIGWVEFEPTPSQPEIQRSGIEPLTPVEQNNNSTAFNLLTRFRLARLSTWIAPIVLLIILVFIYFAVIEQWWYLRLVPAAAVEKIYRRLYRAGRPLAGEFTQAETVYEFMQKLNSRVDDIKAYSNWKKFYMDTQRDVQLLTNTYQASLFKDVQTTRSNVMLAVQTWKRLRWKLLFTRIDLHTKRKYITPIESS